MTSPLSKSLVIVLVVYTFLHAPAGATEGWVKGQVEFVRTHDASRFPTWAAPKFWVTLKNVPSAYTCARFNNGNVLFVGNNIQELSLALAAQASKQELEVEFDDTIVVNGYCAIGHLTVGDPAPTN